MQYMAVLQSMPSYLIVILCPKAVKENENDNYDKALSLENKAKVLNIGGFLLLVIYGLGFIFIAAFGGGSAGAYLT